MRRYDVDWLRVMALGLLIIYHIAVTFQPWAYFIAFIQSQKSLEFIWIFMGLINIWRIPLLFIISGMGVCFAMKSRNWKALLKDRTKRILLPLIFGSLFIVPIQFIIFQSFNNMELAYWPTAAHLWFLENILWYVILLCPIIYYLKNHPNNFLFRSLNKILTQPFALYIITIPFILEAELMVGPWDDFSTYSGTSHGYLLGIMTFFTGFIYISIGNLFWRSVEKIKKVSLIIAIILYIIRLLIFELKSPTFLIVIESWSWLFSIFGFGSIFLNRQSSLLQYLSKAVYPVYILHMVFMNLAAYLVLTQPIRTDYIYTVERVEKNSVAQEVGLIAGDKILNPDWKSFAPNASITLLVLRGEDVEQLSLLCNSEGKIGADINIFTPAIVPKFAPSDISKFWIFGKFILMILLTFLGSILCYEYIIKRVKWLRPLFGLKIEG